MIVSLQGGDDSVATVVRVRQWGRMSPLSTFHWCHETGSNFDLDALEVPYILHDFVLVLIKVGEF